MKKLLGIVVISLLLSGCYETGNYSSNTNRESYQITFIHPDGGTYTSNSFNRNVAISASRLKCTNDNPNSPSDCRPDYAKKLEKPDSNKEKEKKPKKQTPKEKEKKPKKQIPDDNKIVAASSGTGFYVSKIGHIISNHHVIEGCNSVKLTFKGKEINANILAIDKMNDLAILKADLTPLKVYSVATEDASLLEDIIIAGYPLGKKVSSAIKTSKGSITALAGYGDNYSEFQTDAALN